VRRCAIYSNLDNKLHFVQNLPPSHYILAFIMATLAIPAAKETHLFTANDERLPLLNSSTSIRLIDLEHREQDSDIVISIDTYNLLDPLQYVALSYTWGDPLVHPYVAKKPSRTIWIDTKPFLVTPNLYDALNYWRGWKLELGTAKTLLWVDAICINQDDLIERNHQVGLMGQIYSKAALVISWVGTPGEDASIAFELISRLNPIVKLWRSEKPKFTYVHNSDKLFERAGVTKVRPREWMALISFFERQYFSRAWIVQEIVLAKRALLMLGHYFIDWTELTNLSQMMVNCKWIPILQLYAGSSMSAENLRLTLGTPAVYAHIRFLCKQYGPNERDQLHSPTTRSDARAFHVLLELLLYETQLFQATDPRDNIYAILSIVSHAFGATYPTIDLLCPDYHFPVRKVFVNVTRELVTKTGSISVLSLVDHDSKQIPDLPSWVPDYSSSNVQALAYICQGGLYRAYNLVGHSPDPKIVDDVFFLCAMRWDTIANIELTEHPFALQGQMDLCLQLPKIYLNGQTRVEALWRTLIGDTDGEESPAPDAIGNSFCQYVLLAIAARLHKILSEWDGQEVTVTDFVSLLKLKEGSDPWLPGREEIESFCNMCQTMQQSPQENKILLEKLGKGAQLYAAALKSIGSGRKLFKTGGNIFGLAPVAAKPGDTVWFFPSSKVPFILRHYGSKQYKLIGEAYLHGFMHGELEKFSMPLQYISLK
jgi:hypothetical protein